MRDLYLMKRWLAILLIFVLLLNIAGFYGILQAFRYQTEKQIISDLNASRYSQEATQLIKIPLAIPYASDQTDFERVDGKFYHEGNYYRLVKQRLAQDTLYVVCIQDHKTKMFHKVLSDYVKTFADDMADGTADTKTSPSFAKDYLLQTLSYRAMSLGWSMTIDRSLLTQFLRPSYTASISHPPQLS